MFLKGWRGPRSARVVVGSALSEHMAEELPRKHCAFRGCVATLNYGEDLLHHLSAEHKALFDAALAAVSEHPSDAAMDTEGSMFAIENVYNEAIAIATRKGAPVASYAIDRRCIRNYTVSLTEQSVATLVCWCCARRYPYVASRRNIEISWTYLIE